MPHNLLKGSRVYLSGPMDFVASRLHEKRYGWRNRVSQFLRSLGVMVFDPWHKPLVRGFGVYGEEDVKSVETRDQWTFDPGAAGARARAACSGAFWETMHIDLRMVDISDFMIAYCPTNVYSVGTPHEIVIARQQKKPVLFVSPPVVFPALARLKARLAKDREGLRILDRLASEVPIKENPRGVPSLWYMPLVGSENFFDGFGFRRFARKFHWPEHYALDRREREHPPQKPLLPFLADIARGRFPKKWDYKRDRFVIDDSWLLFHQSMQRESR
jgi:hypothetical protein